MKKRSGSSAQWQDLQSIPVMLRLIWAFRRHADVLRLLLGELGQLHAELVEVQARYLLIQDLGEHVDALFVLLVVRRQLDLGDRLVGETRAHHEARVAGGAAEV